MATPKPAKKRKKALTKRSVPNLKKKMVTKRKSTPALKKKKVTKKKSVSSLKKKKVTAKKVKRVPAKRRGVNKMKLLKKIFKPKKYGKPSSPGGGEKATRKLLMDMREKLLADISENALPETLIASTEIGDLIDQAGDERDRELSLLLSGRDKEKLAAIDEALEKLAEGTYGTCEECGDKIGPGRLKVMPLARLCVNCQSKMEKEVSLLRKADEDMTYRGLASSPSSDEEES